MLGDGDGEKDEAGDGDGNRDLHVSLSKTRLLRLLFGVDRGGCWGCCSPEGCSGRRSGQDCALARFGSEVGPKVLGGYLERFDFFQGTMVECYCCKWCVEWLRW